MQLVDFFHLYKKPNFSDLMFVFLSTAVPSEKVSTLKGKNLLPTGANVFLLEQTPFSEGSKVIIVGQFPFMSSKSIW